jgi:2-hydroxy-3-keto-5-methylthiopentenyl-1-phosphate phosphatase
VGDGLSDRFAVDEADVVFAKRQLLAYCQEHGKACHPFDTFAEVEQAIALLIGPSQSGSALSQGERVASVASRVRGY